VTRMFRCSARKRKAAFETRKAAYQTPHRPSSSSSKRRLRRFWYSRRISSNRRHVPVRIGRVGDENDARVCIHRSKNRIHIGRVTRARMPNGPRRRQRARLSPKREAVFWLHDVIAGFDQRCAGKREISSDPQPKIRRSGESVIWRQSLPASGLRAHRDKDATRRSWRGRRLLRLGLRRADFSLAESLIGCAKPLARALPGT